MTDDAFELYKKRMSKGYQYRSAINQARPHPSPSPNPSPNPNLNPNPNPHQKPNHNPTLTRARA